MTSHPFTDKQFPIPWALLTPENAKTDIEYAMNLAKERIEHISNLPDDQLTYESVFKAIDDYDIELSQANVYLEHLTSVRDTEPLRATYKELNPRITDFYTQFFINAKLWHVVKKAAEKLQNADLDRYQRRFIDLTISQFKLNGADLQDHEKQEFSEISIQITKLTDQFKTNVLDSTNAFELYVTDKAELEGLPESALLQAAEDAESKGHKSEYRFTLQFPSMAPVLKYAKNEELRKKIWEGSTTIGHGGKHDNGNLILEILKLRNRKAELLGFKSYADLTLKNRMAGNGDTALNFEDDLHDKVQRQYLEERERLRQYKAKILNQTSPEQLEKVEILPWEDRYYSELQRKELFDFDEESLRPYFSVDQVMNGVFRVTSTIYGIDVRQRNTYFRKTPEDPIVPDAIEVWHPDVKYYDVYDKETQKQLGGFFADWNPREDKRSGAWMEQLYLLYENDPKNVGVIVGNIQKPTAGKPALLNHYEAETIFHEFGHLCHGIVTKASIRSFAGTNVAWDFVELPSQFLENWTWERSALDLFAHHYETGQPIPDDIFNKMVAARNYNSASFMMRQLSFGKIDLEIHHHYAKYKDMNVDQIDELVLQQYRVPCSVKPTSILYNFGHLFSSPIAYSAGYYSYMWAEVLETDAFTRFKKEGILNERVGLEFRDKILIWGDSKPAAELFRDFMGRDPDPSALLIRNGIHQ